MLLIFEYLPHLFIDSPAGITFIDIWMQPVYWYILNLGCIFTTSNFVVCSFYSQLSWAIPWLLYHLSNNSILFISHDLLAHCNFLTIMQTTYLLFNYQFCATMNCISPPSPIVLWAEAWNIVITFLYRGIGSHFGKTGGHFTPTNS